MFLTISVSGVLLHERTDTKALKAVAAQGTTIETIDRELRARGFGHLDEAGEHAWLSVETLRAHATAPGGTSLDEYGAMIAFAEKHGWVQDGYVRAHLELAVSEFRASAPEQRRKWWRSVLGEYPTGVAIISALDGAGHPQGLVVGTFTSVSMDPPLVSYMPMRTSRSYSAVANAERFRVSVLGTGHEDLCRSFASAPPERRFEVGSWLYDQNGLPRLADSVIWFDCVRTQTIEAGDHDIVLGEVEDLGFGSGGGTMPMLFLKGGYGSFTMPRLEFDAQHLGSHLRVASQMGDVVQALAESIDAMVTLCSLTQDSVVVLTAANLRPSPAQVFPVGSTFPFAAPLGVVFAAWGDEGRESMWQKSGRAFGFADDKVLKQMLQRVRERGYAVSVGPAMAEQFEQTISDPAQGDADLAELWAAVARDYADLGENSDWAGHVSSIQVPIFEAGGEANLALAVSGLPRGLNQQDLDRIAGECKRVASQLSAMIGGSSTEAA
ncbi:flavin reductase [Nonomuraea sp. NPDC026600]|uniref:flavin reductase n=1 Tax=Nonomuraea sp. NPDC026600 TaxID=3155363 RepID=UPI0033F36E7C